MTKNKSILKSSVFENGGFFYVKVYVKVYEKYRMENKNK